MANVAPARVECGWVNAATGIDAIFGLEREK